MVEKQRMSYILPGEAFWEIPKVFYRGEARTYRLFEKMTSRMTQDQLAEFHEQEKAKGNPRPTDMPLICAIGTRAYTLKNENPKEAERLRNFLQAGFQKYPNTLTRIIYNPSGEDKIVHNHGTSDEYSIDARVVGPDDWIKEIPDKNVLEKLLGTSNIKQINEVSQWVNRTNSYLWRLNLKPKTKDERVVRFNAFDSRLDHDCYRLNLYCGGHPFDEYPAFRVLKVD